VPSLGVRPAKRGRSKGRFELFRPGGNAAITIQVPPDPDEASEARDWVTRVIEQGAPMHRAPQWTPDEQQQLAVYEHWVADPVARSRVLRRLLAFRDLPRASVISDDGQVPNEKDFEQILAAWRTWPRRPPMRVGRLPRPTLTPDRPLLVAVVGTRMGPPAARAAPASAWDWPGPSPSAAAG